MVYLFLADGFEEVEALTPLDYLRRCEVEVQIVGISGLVIRGSHGIRVMADILPTQMKLPEAEMIILPGGLPGTLNLEKSEAVQNSIDYCVMHDRWIGAICAAPSILGHKGLLKGRKATCYPGYEAQLEGAEIGEPGVYEDGKFITATSVHFAEKFAYKLGAKLLGKSRIDLLRAAVVDKD